MKKRTLQVPNGLKEYRKRRFIGFIYLDVDKPTYFLLNLFTYNRLGWWRKSKTDNHFHFVISDLSFIVFEDHNHTVFLDFLGVNLLFNRDVGEWKEINTSTFIEFLMKAKLRSSIKDD